MCQQGRMATRFNKVEMTENLEKSSVSKARSSEARVNGGNSNKHGGVQVSFSL